MTIHVTDLRVDIGRRRILENVNLTVDTGEFVGVLGPNGSGKSTLLKTIYRVHRPRAGSVTLDGADVHALRPRQVAQRLAVVAQEESPQFDFSVWEMVLIGRTPHKQLVDRDSSEDHDAVADALAHVGASHLAERSVLSLSGGEKQRVLIARALAQNADHIILDEPTNHLDVRYQLEVLEVLAQLDVTVLAALHDLNLAAAYCHRLYLLVDGSVRAAGTPEQVLTPASVRAAFGVDAVVVAHPTTGRHQLMLASPTSHRPLTAQRR